MPITDIVPLIQSHAWVPLAALVIGFLVRTLKSDAFVLPSWAAVAAPYRPLLVLALGVVSGVLDAVVGGTPWRDAIVGGLLSALMALIGHTAIVDVLRGGRDIGAPAPPAEKGPLYQPPAPRESEEVTLPRAPSIQRCSAHYVGGALSLQGSTCDLPAGHAGQHQQKDRRWDATASSRPRGVAQVRVLALLTLLTAIPLSPAVHVAGCAGWWTQNKARVVHTFRAITGACTGFAVSVPEVGPVCLALDQVDRLLEVLAAAQRDRDGVRLRIEIGDVTREVTVPPDQVGALLSHVGQISSMGHAAPAPAASGSAVPR